MEQKDALYWSPRGGNNALDTWGSCHLFTSVQTNPESGTAETDSIIVDLGRHERPFNFEDGYYDRILPVLSDCIDIPNCTKPENEAKAIFLTHAHSDHMFGIYCYSDLNAKIPPVYGSEYTMTQLKKGFVERGVPENKWPEMHSIKAGETVKIGNMKILPMKASHSIPGAFSFKISNESASIFHTGDTKGDESSFLDGGVNFDDYKQIAKEGAIDLMTFDATTATNKGHATYESEIFDTYKMLFDENKDKQMIVPLAAAHCERIATVMAAANAMGKHIIIDGGESLDMNITGVQAAGIDLHKKFPNIKIVGAKDPEADKLNLKDTITITTGIYLEKDSTFVKHLQGQDVGFRMQSDATIIAPLTTDKNEKMETLLLTSPRSSGCKVITAADYPKMYGSGHAQAEDLNRIISILKPKAAAPIHASTVLANKFNAYVAKKGVKTFGAQVYNGDSVKVTDKGCEMISNKDRQQWFGLKYLNQKDGSCKLELAAFKDKNFVIKKEYLMSLLKKRQQEYQDSKKMSNILKLAANDRGRK